jgi:hypothetical protein
MRKIKDISFFQSLKKGSSHPLVLLIAGAIISSIAIPYYTRQWQDHQKELELKTDLAEKLSRAVSSIIVNARLVQNQVPYLEVKDFGNADIEWEISKQTIASRLESYFPDTSIKQEWIDLSTAITEYINLASSLSQGDPNFNQKLCLRMEHVMVIHRYFDYNNYANLNLTDFKSHNCYDRRLVQDSKTNFPQISENINWNILAHKDLSNKNQTYGLMYNKSWLELEKYLQNQKDALIQNILRSHIPFF